LSNIQAKDLPILNDEAINDIFTVFYQLADAEGFKTVEKSATPPTTDYDPDLDAPPKTGKTLTEVKLLLDGIDPDTQRSKWISVGMAMHYESNGDPDWLVAWDEWSAKGAKYIEGEPAKQWESFGRYAGRPVTLASVIKMAKDAEEGKKNFFKNLDWSVSRFVDKPDPIPLIIEGVLPKGIVSLFFSAGGAGKSTILMYLAAKIAVAESCNTDWFGYKIYGGKAVIVTAEDPDIILNHRFVGVSHAIACETKTEYKQVREYLCKNLHIVSTFGHNAHLFKLSNDGLSLKRTDYYNSLVECLSEIDKLKLVVIDTKTRFSQGEGTGNVTATQEITFYEGVASRTGATIMLLHHTNKASRNGSQTGMQAYRDASAIYDSVRAAWYLRGLSMDEIAAHQITSGDEDKYLVLENCKNNYVMPHKPFIIRRDAYSYSARGSILRLTKQEKAARAYTETINTLIDILQDSSGTSWSKAEMQRLCRAVGIGARRTNAAIDDAEADNLIEKNNNRYELTEKGRTYGSSI
jgi:RecA-family ATPase